jgi:catechol 2,3-dioxygenase-like lactoylglutathione lyase family enzyme
MFKRIDHVEIVTDQLERTEQFYTDVRGFTAKFRDRIEQLGSVKDCASKCVLT